MKRIPFNYELYLSGKYDAVYRDSPDKIVSIKPDPNPDYFFKFIVYDESGFDLYISETGRAYSDEESWEDVFLIEKE